MPRFHLVRPTECVRRLCALCCRMHCCRKFAFVTRSLFYNEHFSKSYVIDTILEPMFWLVENYVRRLGPLFVGFLLSMMVAVVGLTYIVIVPYEMLRKSWLEIVIYLFMGHYLLLNCVFNYVMAYQTSPGFVPLNRTIPQTVGMCKHCIAPKPPRTHHCSVCNKCVLKMDHHCPWLNQCIGHFNHRYFLLTMWYMWAGCLLIEVGMLPCAIEHYWPDDVHETAWCAHMWSVVPYANWFCDDPNTDWDSDHHLMPMYRASAYNAVIFVFLVCLGMVIGLGALMCYHLQLIARAETSIEKHINSNTRQQFKLKGKVYRNPYDFGWVENWRIFFSLPRWSFVTFLTHVLLPSTHKPFGDGLTWQTATYTIDGETSMSSNCDVNNAVMESVKVTKDT